ncbi:hypothetical protein CROQUDRAFT_89406 [Cronartium quercuum f. sp. fusiforme G11]|uniref:Uncharacterized protein n=1 Tax=Cronartium quercuum f. sp. fusiforme G11 TaxID=708437 RepID=A0A9P6TEX7_9BASI|nr:hypothetical protein CROQUDRAFT_89406 [Cronartium quercuum f. sp. fusiforme G11]
MPCERSQGLNLAPGTQISIRYMQPMGHTLPTDTNNLLSFYLVFLTGMDSKGLLGALFDSANKAVERITPPTTVTSANSPQPSSRSTTVSLSASETPIPSSTPAAKAPTSASSVAPTEVSTTLPNTALTAVSAVPTVGAAPAGNEASPKSIVRGSAPTPNLSMHNAQATPSARAPGSAHAPGSLQTPGSSSPDSSTRSHTSAALMVGITFAMIVGIAMIIFAFVVQRRRRLNAERIRVAQSQMSQFPEYDKGDDGLDAFSLPLNPPFHLSQTDSGYRKSYMQMDPPQHNRTFGHNLNPSDHAFMPDYPPTMYREHSADLADASLDTKSPSGNMPPEYWKPVYGVEPTSPHTKFVHQVEYNTKAEFMPTQPVLQNIVPDQPMTGFYPYETDPAPSPSLELYPTSPSNVHGSYLNATDPLNSPVEHATRYSTGLAYLTTFRSPYSNSSCSETTGETEGSKTGTEFRSESQQSSHEQSPIDFLRLDLEALSVKSGTSSSTSRASRASQDTIVPGNLPLPGTPDGTIDGDDERDIVIGIC